MANQLLPLIPGSLPVGACYASEQDRLNAYMAVSNAVLAGGLAFYNYGNTKPDVTLQGYPWLNTNDMRWYLFAGQWQTPVNYSTFDSREFRGTLTDLITYDGGDSGSPSPISGPMWVEDTDFQGRSSMSPGAIPTSNPAKTLNLAENYGEGAHQLVMTELPASMPLTAILPGNRTNEEAGGPQWLAPLGSHGALLTTPATESASFAFTNLNGDASHQTTHPVRGLYRIKWSGRLYRVVP